MSKSQSLDPRTKPFYRPRELADAGWGDPKTIYTAIRKGEIPSVKIGNRLLIPTAWVRRAMALDDPAGEETIEETAAS